MYWTLKCDSRLCMFEKVVFKKNHVSYNTKCVYIIPFNDCSINASQVFVSKSFCQIASIGTDDQHKIACIAVNTTCAIFPEVLFGLYQEYYLFGLA